MFNAKHFVHLHVYRSVSAPEPQLRKQIRYITS